MDVQSKYEIHEFTSVPISIRGLYASNTRRVRHLMADIEVTWQQKRFGIKKMLDVRRQSVQQPVAVK
jgi:hypothetical protein